MTTTEAPPRRVRHRAGCTRPDLACTVVVGLRRISCPECQRYITLAAGERSPLWQIAPPTYAQPATAPPPPPPPAFGYACRPHYRPTSWRGTGCPECDQERRDHQRARAAKRAARLESNTKKEHQ